MVVAHSRAEVATELRRNEHEGESRGDAEDKLAERVAIGDRAAFAELYDGLAPAVHGLACRVLRNPALAEEVTQDVFLTVWLKAGTFDRTRGQARTWIMTITHRRAVDAVRREQANRDRLARMATTDEQPGTDVVSERVLERASARWAQEQVSGALESLTTLQRTAVEMAYFDGLTYVQVAERLHIPLPTAKSRIRDGLRRMATLIPADAFPLPRSATG
jgi:RNA polymerase sigma-70 factor (ECF subfamily)